MVYFVWFITLLFLRKFSKGLSRMENPPKGVQFYNPTADKVETIMNGIVGCVALWFALWGHSHMM